MFSLNNFFIFEHLNTKTMDQILDAPLNTERRLNYAGFWIRVGAYFIDAILLSVVNGIIIGVFFGGFGTMSAFGVGMIVPFILNICYFPIMESSQRQATLGKMAVGIKVGDLHGERISLGNALGRYFAKILSGIILFIGFMMVGWDSKNQGLHDKLADTYVFYSQA
jgi:uncharacterized RDD family membrane protein YckC